MRMPDNVATGADFLAWRKARGLTQPEAADLLGWSRASVLRYEADPESLVPRYIALACAAIDAGLASA